MSKESEETWVDAAVDALSEERRLLAFERAERAFGWTEHDEGARSARAEDGFYDDPKFIDEFGLQLKMMVVDDTDRSLLDKQVIQVDGVNDDGTIKYAAGPNYPRGV